METFITILAVIGGLTVITSTAFIIYMYFLWKHVSPSVAEDTPAPEQPAAVASRVVEPKALLGKHENQHTPGSGEPGSISDQHHDLKQVSKAYHSPGDLPALAIERVEPDPYAHLKKAHAEGNIIQYNFFPGEEGWVDWKPLWSFPPDEYRIKPPS